jgi:hypothetical protein
MAIYVDNLGGGDLPVTIINPQDGESLVWDEASGAFINAPSSTSTEVIQDTVAEMLEVDPDGSQVSLRLVSNYDDVTGKLTFNVVADGNGGGDSGPSSLVVRENGTTIGNASTLNFVNSTVALVSGVATITGQTNLTAVNNAITAYLTENPFGFATEEYVNQRLQGFNLEDLADTYVTGVADGQVLVWNQANLRWQPGNVGSGGGGNYTLPTASTSVLGGVKVDGSTIVINNNGVISAVGGGSGGIDLTALANYLTANGYATQTYVNNQVSNIVDGAPTLLNTLNELAAALADNPNFAADVLLKSGGTMTGALTLSGAPIQDLHAATKKYVDDRFTTAPSVSPSFAETVANQVSLGQLSNVNLSNISAGQILGFNGTQFVPVTNSGATGATGPQGAQGPAGLSITSATVTLAGRLQLTLSDNTVVDAGNVSGIKAAVVNSSGELILTKQDNTTINAGNVIGPQGPQGVIGNTGPKGDTGSQGPAGLSVTGAAVNVNGRLIITRSDSSIIDAGAVIGPKGDTGAAGTAGAKGDTGDTGAAGIGFSTATVNGSGRLIITKTDSSTIDAGVVVGPQGQQGATGNTGAQGAKGDRGISVAQAVVDSGNLIITLDDASQINAGSVIGEQGPQGAQGPAGRSIASSGVVVDSSGYLQVTLTDGTTVNAGYVVGPQGSTGATGAKGDKGDKGDIGATGATGATGTSYTVNNKSGSVQVFGIGNTTQPGFDLEVDLANRANRWTTARTLTLSGKVTGLTSFVGSGNITMTTALNAVTTNDISEGTTNRYYTDSRARQSLSSIVDSNITTLISYDDATGQIKYRPNTSYITEGTNLYFTNTRADTRADLRIGASSINALADVDTATSAPTNGQVLTWTGSAWTPSTVSGGSGAVSSVNTKTGNVVLSTDDITEGTSNLYFTNSRWDTRLASRTTDNLSEGATNKYFSNTLARNALAAGTGISYNSSTGTFSLNTSTDNVTEGSSNLYYTTARFDTRLGQSNLNQFADVANTTPTTGQALAWNGSAWAPTTISGGNSGGAGGGGGSGIFKAAVQVEYDASGNLSSVNVLDGGINAVIATATSTTATVTFTFTGSSCAPLNIQVYGYQRASNVFVTRGIGSDYSARTLAGGGSSGSPSAFSAFDASANTMTLSLTRALTGATAPVGQTTHCVVQFLLSA